MKKQIIKARVHHGSKSLDITIPASICREHNISEGDVFTVDLIDDGKELKLTYNRIFKQKSS